MSPLPWLFWKNQPISFGILISTLHPCVVCHSRKESVDSKPPSQKKKASDHLKKEGCGIWELICLLMNYFAVVFGGSVTSVISFVLHEILTDYIQMSLKFLWTSSEFKLGRFLIRWNIITYSYHSKISRGREFVGEKLIFGVWFLQEGLVV